MCLVELKGCSRRGSCGNSEGKGLLQGDLVVTVRAKGLQSEKSVNQSQFEVWQRDSMVLNF